MGNEWNLSQQKRDIVRSIETAVVVGVVSSNQSMETGHGIY